MVVGNGARDRLRCALHEKCDYRGDTAFRTSSVAIDGGRIVSTVTSSRLLTS